LRYSRFLFSSCHFCSAKRREVFQHRLRYDQRVRSGTKGDEVTGQRHRQPGQDASETARAVALPLLGVSACHSTGRSLLVSGVGSSRSAITGGRAAGTGFHSFAGRCAAGIGCNFDRGGGGNDGLDAGQVINFRLSGRTSVERRDFVQLYADSGFHAGNKPEQLLQWWSR